MSDELDFEELDAAVNNLLSKSEDDQKSREDRSTIVNIAKKQFEENISAKSEKLETNPNQAANKEINPDNNHKKRVRGHFMDIIHPSSDVSISNKINKASSQTAKIIPAEKSNELTNLKLNAKENENSAENAELEKVFTENTSFVKQPKLDSANAKTSPSEITSNPIKKKTDNFESPFLPNAAEKVADEKRNLGTPSPIVDWIRDFTEAASLSENNPSNEISKTPEISNEKQEITKSTNLISTNEPEAILAESNFITEFLSEARNEIKQQNSSDNNSATDKSEELSSNQAKKIAEKVANYSSHENPKKIEKVAQTRSAITNTMIMPQYKSSETAQITSKNPPYVATATESESFHHEKSRFFQIVSWILIFVLIIVIGAGIGAWIYVNGIF